MSRARKTSPDLGSTAAILESISDGVFTVDLDWRITFFNRAAEEVTGVSRADAVGRLCSEVFRASTCEAACALRHTLATGEPVIGRAAFIVDAEGRRVPISVSTALLLDERGEVVGGAETFRDQSVVEQLRSELTGRFRIGDMVSRSPAMRRVFELVPMVAASDCTVLVHGETGTGKEVLARAIHEAGPRSRGPFVALNCGALPDTLLESELFGYEPGAFTGAAHAKAGRLGLAEGGTLFLDEVGEVSPALQVRLLRVLQDRTYEPLGATASRTADIRVIAATNKDIDEAVANGSFRRDLFYRLNVMRIALPPLRSRREDVPLLAQHFVDRFNRIQGKALRGLGPEALAILMAHDFPGNVRELENVVEHAFVLCAGGTIDAAHLPEELVGRRSAPRAAVDVTSAVRAAEEHAIREALRRTGGNRLEAARELGMHKSTLFRKVRALGIELPEADGRKRPASK